MSGSVRLSSSPFRSRLLIAAALGIHHRAALNALTQLTGTCAGPKSSDWNRIVAR
jgi:hypothetical protein